MAEDLFAKFLALAKKKPVTVPKAPKTNLDRFKDALKAQVEKFQKIGTPEFTRANTDWFMEKGDGTFEIRFGRPMVTFGKNEDGPINYIVCQDKAHANEVFGWVKDLADNNEEFGKKVEAAYSAPPKTKSKAAVISPSAEPQKKRTRGPNKPKPAPTA